MRLLDEDLLKPRATVETVDVGFNKEELKYLLQNSIESWIEFHMKGELKFAVPQFHIDCFRLMTAEKVDQVALALPRGHAKTTLAKLAVIWYYCFTEVKFILYVSNTFTIAQQACEDIITFMKEENFVKVFGSITNEAGKILKDRGSKGRWDFALNGKVCTLRALGAGQQIRGMNVKNTRPQVMVIDDLEDYEDTGKDDQINKLKKWTYGPLFKAIDKRLNKKIWIGNYTDMRCMLKALCESPYWYSMRLGALLEDGNPLWKDLWPIEELMKDFNNYKLEGMTASWFAEMQNMPVPGGSGLIKPEDIKYRVPVTPMELEYAFITVDPAFSKQRWANKSAVTVHGYFDNAWQVVDYFSYKVNPEELFYVIDRFSTEYKTRLVGIEKVSAQAALTFTFKHFAMSQGKHDYNFVDVPAGQATKTERLAAWCSMIRTGDYFLNDSDFGIVTQLLHYDPGKRDNEDDLIDSCSMGKFMIENHMAHILQTRTKAIMALTTQSRSEHSVCSI